MLRLTDVHTHYGLSHVLQGVSLEVGAGEVVGLFGRNGVGKTTLIKTVAGWVRPSRGHIEFDGVPITGLSSDVICRRGIGLVPEDRRIFPGLTVEENLQLGAMQAPTRAKTETRRKLDAIYTRFPRLGERRAQLGTTLSGGEQQMLAMARVMVGAPRLLLIDEPSEGLAPKVVDEVFRLIDAMRNDGLPIVLVEQNVRRALDIVDRFYALERGQIVFHGSAASESDREELMARIAI
ncbi:MAG TPA: ABC transporter ATP-binding protein [Burkholderiaceae bacterium]|jgi:branched-chain amino acid transport system ATP-binding protein|nr:ABC transporter ATP-binding protein [Burkholderiaceae bacterium]